MTSSTQEARDVKPTAEAIAEARRRYLALAASSNPGDRRLGEAQLQRLERATAPKTKTRPSEAPGVDLAALIKETAPLKDKGSGKFVGPCPWHSSRSGECLVVWADEGRWWCSSCKRGGDAVAWVALVEGISFGEARKRLGLPHFERRSGERSWSARIRAAATAPGGREDE